MAVPVGIKKSLRLDIPEAIELGLKLQRLSSFPRFEEFTKGFYSLNQFEDTWFEAQAADWCVSQSSIQSLEFAPPYVVKGRTKKPDFQLSTDAGILVCECKRIHQLELEAQQLFTRRAAAFNKALQEVGNLPPDFRLEIQIKSPIRSPIEALAKQAIERAHQISSNNGGEFEEGPLIVNVCRRDVPIIKHSEAKTAEYFYTINSGTWTPVLQHPRVTPAVMLCVTTDLLDKYATGAVKERLKQARDQLPTSQKCAIFLRVVSSRVAKEICIWRVNNPSYSHINMIMVWGDSEANIAHRKTDRPLVEQLFGEQVIRGENS